MTILAQAIPSQAILPPAAPMPAYDDVQIPYALLLSMPASSSGWRMSALNLESIAVNGQKLPIDSSLFATSKSQGTVLDSGTALTYLVHGAYGPFVSAGNDTVWCIGWQGNQVLQNIGGIALLGGIVLHDRVIVYDLGKERVGWTDYNCSSLNRTSSFDVSGASSYYSGLTTIVVVAVVWLGGLLADHVLS
ncbi:hypothetical protein ACQ4PT_012968 [Festuca glaucescens]